MKLIKFIPALSAVLVLAACSTVENAATGVADSVTDAAKATTTAVKDGVSSVKNVVMGKSVKTVVYRCQDNNAVVASYEFDGEKATAVTLTVNNVAVKNLIRDDSQKDFVAFKSKTHLFNVDNGLTLSTFDKTDAVTLVKHAKTDEILAKDCSVNAEATAKLNK